MGRSQLAKEKAEKVQPAYAKNFGVASVHLSRRCSEGKLSNSKSVDEEVAQSSTGNKSGQQILEILHKWGIHTLGQLAGLDKEELRVRLGPEAVRFWERANGTSTRLLKFVLPPESFAERFEFEHEIETAEPLLFMLRRFLEQLTVRLSAIYLVAKELSLQITFANRQHYERVFKIPQPTNDVDLLFRMLHTTLENFRSEHPIVSVSLEAQPIKPASRQFGLFETALGNPHQFYETLARLTALLGTDRVGTPIVEQTHRPDAFHIELFAWNSDPDPDPHLSDALRRGELVSPVLTNGTLLTALRRFRPNLSVVVLFEDEKPIHLRSGKISGKVVAQRGPYLASGNWWNEKSWKHMEWDLELEDGSLLRCSQGEGSWQIDGVYD
jgi:protein ImuB